MKLIHQCIYHLSFLQFMTSLPTYHQNVNFNENSNDRKIRDNTFSQNFNNQNDDNNELPQHVLHRNLGHTKQKVIKIPEGGMDEIVNVNLVELPAVQLQNSNFNNKGKSSQISSKFLKNLDVEDSDFLESNNPEMLDAGNSVSSVPLGEHYLLRANLKINQIKTQQQQLQGMINLLQQEEINLENKINDLMSEAEDLDLNSNQSNLIPTKYQDGRSERSSYSDRQPSSLKTTAASPEPAMISEVDFDKMKHKISDFSHNVFNSDLSQALTIYKSHSRHKYKNQTPIKYKYICPHKGYVSQAINMLQEIAEIISDSKDDGSLESEYMQHQLRNLEIDLERYLNEKCITSRVGGQMKNLNRLQKLRNLSVGKGVRRSRRRKRKVDTVEPAIQKLQKRTVQ